MAADDPLVKPKEVGGLVVLLALGVGAAWLIVNKTLEPKGTYAWKYYR